MTTKNNKILKKYKRLPIDSLMLQEAVIYPEAYIKEIEKVLKNPLLKKSIVNFTTTLNLCKRLSFILRKYKIDFIEAKTLGNTDFPSVVNGINGGFTLSDKYSTIKIEINSYANNIKMNDNYFNLFIDNLLIILKHELIHRGQRIHIGYKKLKKLDIFHDKEFFEYLKDKHELMSYAFQIIQEFKLSGGYSDAEILTYIQKGDSGIDRQLGRFSFTLFIYKSAFNSQPEVLKQLYKYIYEYLTD